MGLSTVRPRLVLAGAAMLALAAVTDGRAAAADPLRLEATDPAEPARGDLGPAKAAVQRGPRPASLAIVAAKREADAAYEAAVRNGALSPAGPDDLVPAGGPAKAAGGPTIVDGRSFAGLTDRLNNLSPSDATGAIGPTRFIQLVNARFGIYARDGKQPLATGDLTQLAGVARDVFVFDPQIIWDPAARRFYYVIDSIYGGPADNCLQVGFSRTDSPASAADWCHYQIRYGKEFPDFPKLGDSGAYGLIGVNVFANTSPYALSRRAALIAIRKPPAGRDCPAETSFSGGVAKDLRDADGRQGFTPVPANQVDAAPDGYAGAISRDLPSNRPWLFSGGRGPGGGPGGGRGEPPERP